MGYPNCNPQVWRASGGATGCHRPKNWHRIRHPAGNAWPSIEGARFTDGQTGDQTGDNRKGKRDG